jgi:chemotaxis protein MotB
MIDTVGNHGTDHRRPPLPEDKAAWSELFQGYRRFYKMPDDAAVIETVWNWIHDPGEATEMAENGETNKPGNGELDEGALQEAMAAQEQEQFEAAAASLRQAIESVPELLDLQDSLMIEQTPEGLRIQLVDQKGYSMFALGSSQPNEQTRNLVQLVTRAVGQLPHKISISGYTDSRAYRSQEGHTNWELSSDRANSARRLLIEAGLSSERIAIVQGRADTDPLLPDDPESERNRRISIVLLRENAVPVNIQDTVTPSELGSSEPAIAPSRKTELDTGNSPG